MGESIVRASRLLTPALYVLLFAIEVSNQKYINIYIYYIYIKTTINNVIQFHPMLLPSKSIKINLSAHNEAYQVARSGIHNCSDKNKEAH